MEPTTTVAAAAIPAAVAISESMSFIDLFEQGGFIMYPLIILSIMTWVVAIHKFFVIRNFASQFRSLYQEASSLIVSGRMQDLKWLFNKGGKAIAIAHEAIFDESLNGSKEEINERLSRRLDASLTELKKGLWVLGTITSATPFIGLFGTIMGIMSSFKSIGASGKTGLGVVSAGISEALIATAAGIVIAVVALSLFNYLQVKIQNVFQEFRNRVQDLSQIILLEKSQNQNYEEREESRNNRDDNFGLPPIINNNGYTRNNKNNNNNRGVNYGK